MWNTIKSWFNNFKEKHVVAVFPYPAECWDCKKGSCEGCHLDRRFKS